MTRWMVIKDRIGFNRYMVECECFSIGRRYWIVCVLIDTWWNVNTTILLVVEVLLNVLIDTWWNVNAV
mgnify:CR=1 FL=1